MQFDFIVWQVEGYQIIAILSSEISFFVLYVFLIVN